MRSGSRKHRRLALFAVGLTLATCAPASRSEVAVRFRRLHGFEAPGTPARLDKAGVLEIGPGSARNVLVLNPGTSASAAYFAPLAKTVVSKAKGWQVWAVERRENQLEDHSMLDRVLDAATLLADQSNIPQQNLTLIDHHETYAHNDPNSASPQNDFVDGLVPFLAQIRQDRRR